MGRRKEPVDLIIAKGKSHHISQKEYEKRKKEELTVETKKITPPIFLSTNQKKEFNKLAKRLLELKVLTDLDVGCLTGLVVAKANYEEYTEQLSETMKESPTDYEAIGEVFNLQDKAFKQFIVAARELGLTPTARCKIILPPEPEKPKVNKFEKFKK